VVGEESGCGLKKPFVFASIYGIWKRWHWKTSTGRKILIKRF
jgi:hypothetical protein